MTATSKAEANGHSGRGPRGGTTTFSSSGMVKKNLWVSRELAEMLRDAAYLLKTSEAEVMREALELWRRRHWSDGGERARERAAAGG